MRRWIKAAVVSLALLSLLAYFYMTAQATIAVQQEKIAGQIPQKLNQIIASDNRTHVVYLFFSSGCTDCEKEHWNFFLGHSKAWTNNVSAVSVDVEAIDYAKESDRGKKIIEAFNIPRRQFGETFVAIYNRVEGLVLSPLAGDAAINSAVKYFVYGVSSRTEARAIITSKPIIFFMGVTTGINPCLLALASLLSMSTTLRNLAYVAKRVFMVISGILYVQLALVFILFSVPSLVVHFSAATAFIVFALGILGAFHLAEAAHDFFTAKWKSGSAAKLPLFRTPQRLKIIIRKMSLEENLYFDFALGALFALVKLPCLAAGYLLVFLSNPGELIWNTIVFNSGYMLPITLIALLTTIGVLETSRVTAIGLKGRLAQRAIIGIMLVASALVIIAQ